MFVKRTTVFIDNCFKMSKDESMGELYYITSLNDMPPPGYRINDLIGAFSQINAAMKRKNPCWRATDALQGQDNSNKTLSSMAVFEPSE